MRNPEEGALLAASFAQGLDGECCVYAFVLACANVCLDQDSDRNEEQQAC